MNLSKLITLDKLITIAASSTIFRQKLLTSPEQALTIGYEGYTLQLIQEDKEILLRANAKSLEELAEYILNKKMTSVNRPAILLVSDYPLMTDALSILLKNEFNVRKTEGHDPDDQSSLAHYAMSQAETQLRGHKFYWHQGTHPDIEATYKEQMHESQLTRIMPLAP